MEYTKYTIGNDLSLLDEDQVNHFNKICKILSKNHMYIDISMQGLGKSYIALAICITFNLPLMVVGPVASLSMWKKMLRLY